MTYPDVPLRRVVTIVNGGTPSPGADNWNGDVAWATPVDLGRAGLFIDSTDRTLTQQGLLSGSRAVRSGSLILSTRAPIGHLAITQVEMAFNQGCRGLVPSDQVDVRFLAYQLTARTSDLQAAGQGSTFMELSGEALGAVRVTLPPLDVQRRVADFLDHQVDLLDRASDLRRRQADLLDEHLDAEASDLLIGSTDSLREGVQLRRFLRSIKTGGTPTQTQQQVWDEEGVPWFGPGSFSNGLRLGEPTKRIVPQALADGVVPTFPAGAVLIVGIGATAGRVAYSGEVATGNQQLTALLPAAGVDGRYLAWSLWVRRRMLLATAPYTTLPILNNETLRSVRITPHTSQQQAQIVSRLEALADARDAASALFETSRSLLTERKNALIADAVAGQTDLTTARSAA